MEYTKKKLQTLHDKDKILLFERKIIRVGISLVMDSKSVKSDENENLLYNDAKSLHGWAIIWSLFYDEIKMLYFQDKMLHYKMFWILKLIVILVVFLKLIEITQME